VHFTSFSCLFLDKLHPNQNCHTLQNCRLNCFFQYYTEIYVEQGESTVRLGTQLLLLYFLMIHLINAVMYRYLTTCARLQNVLSRRCGFCGNGRHIPNFFFSRVAIFCLLYFVVSVRLSFFSRPWNVGLQRSMLRGPRQGWTKKLGANEIYNLHGWSMGRNSNEKV
jgi:hypothetical protein